MTSAPWPAEVGVVLLIVYVIAGLVAAIVLAVKALRATRVPA